MVTIMEHKELIHEITNNKIVKKMQDYHISLHMFAIERY